MLVFKLTYVADKTKNIPVLFSDIADVEKMEKTYKSDVIWTLSFSIESQAMNRFMLLCCVICTHLLKDPWKKMLYSFKINHLYETPKCSQGSTVNSGILAVISCLQSLS